MLRVITQPLTSSGTSRQVAPSGLDVQVYEPSELSTGVSAQQVVLRQSVTLSVGMSAEVTSRCSW